MSRWPLAVPYWMMCHHEGPCWCKKKYGWILGAITGILIAKLAHACLKGSYEWKGDCAVDIQPEIAKPAQPSDEKPPSDKMPSWERADVSVVTAPNMNDADVNADKAKFQADQEGKQVAGLKPK